MGTSNYSVFGSFNSYYRIGIRFVPKFTICSNTDMPDMETSVGPNSDFGTNMNMNDWWILIKKFIAHKVCQVDYVHLEADMTETQ